MEAEILQRKSVFVLFAKSMPLPCVKHVTSFGSENIADDLSLEEGMQTDDQDRLLTRDNTDTDVLDLSALVQEHAIPAFQLDNALDIYL